MEQLQSRLRQLQGQIAQAAQRLDLKRQQSELEQLQKQIASPGFWVDSHRAQAVSKQAAELAGQIEPWQKLAERTNDLWQLVEIGDVTMQAEITPQLQQLETEFNSLKKELRFAGPYDNRDVILSIHAGAGGTDAQDWVQMLLRMYLRYSENQNLKAKIVEQTAGEEAGIKSATVKLVGGSFLYGKFKGEHGVHRLVRLSPFNADNLRQTSFAKVEVLPSVDRPEEVAIDEKDLKIDVFRSGGAGGQSVNTTDSAVRVTHSPTGISVAIQNERSQLQNKETAMTILRSRLAALQLQQHTKSLADIRGPNQSAEWGNQIRSYVLHPYKQVKDLRSGYETSDAQKVLDGALDPLIEAYLEHFPGSS